MFETNSTENFNPDSSDFSEVTKGFSKLSKEERYLRLHQLGLLTKEDIEFLQLGGLQSTSLAEHFIENVIGYFQLPLGVAMNFKIDGRDVIIPMAVEETSIIAAASKTAKWVREEGQITTRTLGNLIIGQIQIASSQNPEETVAILTANKQMLIEKANVVAAGLVRRGGGVRDITFRILPREDGKGSMVVLHVLCDPCDAMGANIINQVCEALKKPVEDMTGESVLLCILSNLVDTRLTEAKVEIYNIDPEIGRGIEEASKFAELDPYRAATNNKGVLNGIDPIVIATGNDWRAVEAGIHAYAARSGRYSSITKWRVEGSTLVGSLIAPIIVGTVGGVTKLHPTAQLCLRMLQVNTADEVSRIMAAVGLVQNLGALKALSTVGVVQGHMKLHAANLALMAGAQTDEIESIQRELEQILRDTRRVSLSNAIEALDRLRREKEAVKEAELGTLSPQ